MPYEVEFDPEAVQDIRFHRREASWIFDQIEERLRHTPMNVDRNRHPSRAGAPAAWELRAIPFRVFYEVDEAAESVYVVAVYQKVRERWFRRGKEETLDE